MQGMAETKMFYITQVGSTIAVVFAIFVWSLWKIIKLIQKYIHIKEPSVVLELITLTNIPLLLLTVLSMKIMMLVQVDWLAQALIVLFFGTRLFILGDWCMGQIDKFLALYWNSYYKTRVTTRVVIVASIITKVITSLMTILLVALFR